MTPGAPASASVGPPLYLTAEQVADLLQVSPKSVFRWAAEDPSMPMLRLGGKTVRFPKERLLAWLRAREQGPGRARRSRIPSSPTLQPRATSNGDGSAPAPCANPCATEALQEAR